MNAPLETTVGNWIAEQGGSIKTGPFGTVLKAHEYTEHGVPLISVKEIGVGRFMVDESTPKVDAAITERLPEYVLAEGDIVFARKGAVDRSAMVSKSESGWFLGSDGIRLRPPANCNPKFVAYYFQSSRTQRWLLQHATGTTMPSLNNKIIESVPIHVPERETQDNVAEILSSLDEKIELNRRQNHTLEAIAQALFKHWFVDFEFPDENGRPYKSSGGAMQPSELGEIPVGWKVGRFKDEFNINMGQSPSGDSYNETGDGLVFFQGRTDFGFRYPEIRMYCTEPKKRAQKGDILLSVRAPVGDLNIATETCCIGRGLAAVSSDHQSYAFHKLKYCRTLFDVFESEGTVFGSISKSGFENIQTVVPNTRIRQRFESVVADLDDKIELATTQNTTLASLRDTLLPKLMSGELRVT